MLKKSKKESPAVILKKIRAKINSFDYDFDGAGEFLLDVIKIAYPARKSNHAARIVREFEDCV